MFMDLKRSTDYLIEHQKDYLYCEETTLTKQVEKMSIEWSINQFLHFFVIIFLKKTKKQISLQIVI